MIKFNAIDMSSCQLLGCQATPHAYEMWRVYDFPYEALLLSISECILLCLCETHESLKIV